MFESVHICVCIHNTAKSRNTARLDGAMESTFSGNEAPKCIAPPLQLHPSLLSPSIAQWVLPSCQVERFDQDDDIS